MIEWMENPGYCPVYPSTVVDVRFRDGTEIEGIVAQDLAWTVSMADDDVAYYRVKNWYNGNLERDDNGRWWLEVPQSATIHDITKAAEVLNNV